MRLKGHSLYHLATAAGGGLWLWECECGHRSFGYVDTTAIARTQHREHKLRIGTPAEHATMQVSPRLARCICGHHIAGLAGGMPSWDELTERFEAHRAEVETSSNPLARPDGSAS